MSVLVHYSIYLWYQKHSYSGRKGFEWKAAKWGEEPYNSTLSRETPASCLYSFSPIINLSVFFVQLNVWLLYWLNPIHINIFDSGQAMFRWEWTWLKTLSKDLIFHK